MWEAFDGTCLPITWYRFVRTFCPRCSCAVCVTPNPMPDVHIRSREDHIGRCDASAELRVQGQRAGEDCACLQQYEQNYNTHVVVNVTERSNNCCGLCECLPTKLTVTPWHCLHSWSIYSAVQCCTRQCSLSKTRYLTAEAANHSHRRALRFVSSDSCSSIPIGFLIYRKHCLEIQYAIRYVLDGSDSHFPT